MMKIYINVEKLPFPYQYLLHTWKIQIFLTSQTPQKIRKLKRSDNFKGGIKQLLSIILFDTTFK